MTLHRRELLTAGALLPLLAACGSSESGSSPGASGTDSSEATGTAPTPSESTTAASATPSSTGPKMLAGRCLMVGMTPDADIDEIADLVSGHRLAGAFLLGSWTSTSQITEAVAALHRAARSTGLPGALVAADQEGGLVHNLQSEAFTTVPSAERLGQGDPATCQRLAATTGAEMRKAGLNMVLAPVADVVDPEVGADNAPVGALHRGYGTDPQKVGRFVTAAVKGFTGAGIVTSIKHFPGLGAVRTNTDLGAATDRTTGADSATLASFRAGIAAGSQTVMISSAVYSRIDPDSPAVFSRAVVTDLLRSRLGFSGVVVSDDLGAAKAVAATPAGRRATRFLRAGGDLVLCADPSLVPSMVSGLVDAAGDSSFARTLAASARRVDRLVSGAAR
ncbi:glycoside hydrolase family 3 N-terminal domain-containing protein [Acidipropionibacterium virtanenii]|uniref:beta-N-acetylhexosaminidase n=1 Tax=Acidipropionibacterium virtanenii TaxID=2057246 RepID=A0A344UUF0_9ACTN|nr:glycoside hydrolase family 3 N-terminal domain-containing protein [Acidipropionibacterium virtanenii]AXE38898.1 Beta-hexosaminidase [Acidipropionibacterium virtanenii]